MNFHIIEQYTIVKMNQLQMCVTEGLGVRFPYKPTDRERDRG